MFIEEPGPSSARQAMYDGDVRDKGYVMNLTRAWAWIPAVHDHLFGLLDETATAGGLSFRDKAILITAMASTLGDSYCTLAWGTRLAHNTDPSTAAAVINAEPTDAMTHRDLALASWARKVAADPNSTTQGDVNDLRLAGLSDVQIMAVTVYIGLRLAFSSVNDAIGIAPDRQAASAAPPEVAGSIRFGRIVAETPSGGS